METTPHVDTPKLHSSSPHRVLHCESYIALLLCEGFVGSKIFNGTSLMLVFGNLKLKKKKILIFKMTIVPFLSTLYEYKDLEAHI